MAQRDEPSFGHRTIAGMLGMNKNTVQRIFQIKVLTGAQAGDWQQAAVRGAATGRDGARRSLRDGLVPVCGGRDG